jgi:hypothetical protein
MKKCYQKASKKLSNMSHQIYYDYKYCFSPDLPAELGRGPDSEYWGRGGILLTDPLLVGLFAPSTYSHPEYKQAFGSRPRILRTPAGKDGTPSNPSTPHPRTPEGAKRPTSRGSVSSMPKFTST